jgi:hypothetical protein
MKMQSRRAERKLQGQVFEDPLAYSHVHGSRLILGWAVAGLWLLALTMTFCGPARAQDSDTLMLVREWNPQTGRLIGWLPTHRIAMSFEFVGIKKEAAFNPNEAVSILWFKRQESEPGSAGDVRISPAVREFDGQKWLPLARDTNMVRIKNNLFLIKQIIFEGSTYSRATKVRSKACSDAQGSSKSFAKSCAHDG